MKSKFGVIFMILLLSLSGCISKESSKEDAPELLAEIEELQTKIEKYTKELHSVYSEVDRLKFIEEAYLTEKVSFSSIAHIADVSIADYRPEKLEVSWT